MGHDSASHGEADWFLEGSKDGGGRGDFDHRQRGVIQFVYKAPFAKQASGWKRLAFADWQASGDFTAQSGAPFTVNVSSDQANVGAGPAQRPNVAGDQNNGPKTPDQWLNAAVFSLQKNFSVKERAKVSSNVTNHPNFNIPNRTALTPVFGKISSAQDSRQIQLALKVAF
ncbi:MAG TPA: hypothetical protein VG297_11495 [Bryobacteraceae bacterium]|nr:hypothetical protein [Bryobacteraceae bacterium]